MNLLLVSSNETQQFKTEVQSFYKKFPINVTHSTFEPSIFYKAIASISSDTQAWILFQDDSNPISFSEHFNLLKEVFQNEKLKLVIGKRKIVFSHWIEKLAYEKFQKSLQNQIKNQEIDFFSPLVLIKADFFTKSINNWPQLNNRTSAPWAYLSLKACLETSNHFLSVPIRAQVTKKRTGILDALKVLIMPVKTLN